jgi:hypothetical protein
VIKGCYNFANTASPIVGFRSTSAYINSNVAVNAGNGYIVNVPIGTPSVDVIIESPLIGGQPDKTIVNATNGVNVRMLNAQYMPGNTPVNVSVSSGVTYQGTPAATLDVRCARTVILSTSATSITTLKSGLQPGEFITFYTTGGSAQFATGGNLSLGNNLSPFIVNAGDSATFMRVDSGTPAFILVGYSQQGKAAADFTAQTANIGSTLLYAVPATGAGTYRVTVYIIVTSVGTTSTMPNVLIAYTDKDNNTAQSVPFTTTSAGNTLTTLAVNSLPISAKASTNINFSTASYASTGTPMQYALHIRLEYLGS